MVEAIGESGEGAALATSIEYILEILLFKMGHRPFSDKELGKMFVRQVARAFGDKAEDLAE